MALAYDYRRDHRGVNLLLQKANGSGPYSRVMAKKNGIPAIIAALSGPVIGLIDRKRRDSATPKKMGRLRDAGAAIAGIGATSSLAYQAGTFSVENLPLTEPQMAWINLIMCVTGAILYLTGIGKTTEPGEDPSEDKTPEK